MSVALNSPKLLVADGMSITTITATLVLRGESSDGERIMFSIIGTDGPVARIFDALSDAERASEGYLAKGDVSVGIRTSAGRATAYVLAPENEDRFEIKVNYETNEGELLTKTETLSFSPPPIISASQVAGALSAIQNHFLFECMEENVGAWIPDRDAAIEISCDVQLFDANARRLHFVPVKLFSEAGHFRYESPTRSKKGSLIYEIPTLLSNRPIDVSPNTEESSRGLVEAGEGLIPAQIEQNPRDGLVTLLAAVWGAEGFDDLNGNGMRDEGEPFFDEGEPFLDKDDDGIYSPLIDGPLCCDSNGNGEVDGPNGVWDKEAWLGRMTYILWTSTPDRFSLSMASGSGDLIALGSDSLQARVMDANFNPVASIRDNDEVVLNDMDGPMVVVGEESFAIESVLGWQSNTSFPAFAFGRGAAPLQLLSTGEDEGGRLFSWFLRDERPLPTEEGDEACFTEGWQAQVGLRLRSVEGNSQNYEETLLGTVLASDEAICSP